jgi:nucleoside-diphosphate-sugar epimerase
MMRIAIAGGGGLGYLLASGFASAATAYNIVVLSRTERMEFADLDVQVHVVDYNDYDSLSFALQGIDLVISTVCGQEQLNLINAAGNGRVRHFVPSEFEGSLSHRPSQNDPLDRGSSQALALLRQWSRASRRMQYTVFSCGIFMERFYGLNNLNMGYGTGIPNADDYLIDISTATAEYVENNSRGGRVRVCLTSVHDLVSFVVAAVDLGLANWPHEWTLRGDRLSMQDLVGACSRALHGNTPPLSVALSVLPTDMVLVAFQHQKWQYNELNSGIHYFTQTGEYDKVARYQRLLATADGRYDFSRATLNEAVGASGALNVRPMTFGQWLTSIWQMG